MCKQIRRKECSMFNKKKIKNKIIESGLQENKEIHQS